MSSIVASHYDSTLTLLWSLLQVFDTESIEFAFASDIIELLV